MTTYRRGSDFRACVQDSRAANGKALAPQASADAIDVARAKFEGFRARAAGWATSLSGRVSGRAFSRLPHLKAWMERTAARPGAKAGGAPDRGAHDDLRWAAELAREYRREFHPVEAARRPPQTLVDANPTPADGAAAAVFLAGKTAWKFRRWLEPAERFLSVYSAPILKVAAVAFVILGAAGFLAQWPEREAGDAPASAAAQKTAEPAPRSSWQEIAKPARLYDLAAPQLAREKRFYAARRHTVGGGRDDALTFGEFTGTGPFLRISIYRHGSEKTADAPFFVDMARRAGQLGLSLSRVNTAETQATRFGDVETSAMTMAEGRIARENCRGFRFSAAQLGLTIAGFACGPGEQPISGGDLACLVDRLDLLSAGEDRALRDFFAAALSRGARGCADAAPAPVKPLRKG